MARAFQFVPAGRCSVGGQILTDSDRLRRSLPRGLPAARARSAGRAPDFLSPSSLFPSFYLFLFSPPVCAHPFVFSRLVRRGPLVALSFGGTFRLGLWCGLWLRPLPSARGRCGRCGVCTGVGAGVCVCVLVSPRNLLPPSRGPRGFSPRLNRGFPRLHGWMSMTGIGHERLCE